MRKVRGPAYNLRRRTDHKNRKGNGKRDGLWYGRLLGYGREYRPIKAWDVFPAA